VHKSQHLIPGQHWWLLYHTNKSRKKFPDAASIFDVTGITIEDITSVYKRYWSRVLRTSLLHTYFEERTLAHISFFTVKTDQTTTNCTPERENIITESCVVNRSYDILNLIRDFILRSCRSTLPSLYQAMSQKMKNRKRIEEGKFVVSPLNRKKSKRLQEKYRTIGCGEKPKYNRYGLDFTMNIPPTISMSITPSPSFPKTERLNLSDNQHNVLGTSSESSPMAADNHHESISLLETVRECMTGNIGSCINLIDHPDMNKLTREFVDRCTYTMPNCSNCKERWFAVNDKILDVCIQCKHNIVKFSSRNDMDPLVPQQFEDSDKFQAEYNEMITKCRLNFVEESLIARNCVCMTAYRLKGGSWGFRGNVISFPQEIVDVCTTLPRLLYLKTVEFLEPDVSESLLAA